MQASKIIIKRLGYEKAKVMLQGLGNEHDAALLEYRRQNGFFEVGDWVVSTLYGSGDNLFQFESWLVDLEDCIRHANDAEIEANRRLDCEAKEVL
ncbi:hypothetical protein [Acinetobacter sp.]|uniref:hypothetical protein n=1 Tax=Acinetobacter sp. TaxID=472 RepID=UPI00388D91BE